MLRSGSCEKNGEKRGMSTCKADKEEKEREGERRTGE